MTKLNEAITGPLGAWINTFLLALVIFFSSKAWAVAEKGLEMLYDTRTDVRVLQKEVEILQRVK